MATSWLSAEVKCPFYISDDGVKLTCENGLEHALTMNHKFESTHEKIRHMKRCCCNNYQRCLYYRLIAGKYSVKE